MRSVFLHAITVACVVLHAAQAMAQATDEPLRLEDALKRALAQHPELAGFVFELRAQQARIGEAALSPGAQAELLIEDAVGTGELRGFTSAQTTLSLSHVIELGGKREGRVAAAEAARARIMTTQAARQLDVAAEVARRFVDTLAEQAQLELAQEAVKLAERTRDAVVQRVRAARAPAVEQARAEVRLTQAEIELKHAERELAARRQLLAAAMGEREARFGRIEGALLELPPAPELEQLLGRLEASPDFMRFADEARLLDAELRLAELQRRPDVRTTLGVRRYEAGDDVALVAGFSIPLQSARRAQPAIDVARAERARSESEREAWLTRMRAQLFAEYQEQEHVRLEVTTLRDSIIPRLQAALEQMEIAYQRGRYSYLEWTDAQRELLQARRRLHDLAATFHTVRIEIERLTGESLESFGATP